MQPKLMSLAALLLASFAAQACGGDSGGGGGDKKKKADEAAKKKKADDDKKKKAKKSGKKPEEISFIRTLEQIYLDKDGKPIKLRTHLVDRDFTATENRDPFRSFVMPLIAQDAGATQPQGPVVQPTPTCKKQELVASNFAIDDLDLIGVIRRGNKRFALFRDTRGVGHMVERNKCLGREKGKITEIGDALVCYETTPEQPANTTTIVVPEKKCIPLYPSEITDTGEEGEDLGAEQPDEPAPSTVPAPPPSLPPPSTTPLPPPGGP
jgi:Tfp pilus assembly protein PilP